MGWYQSLYKTYNLISSSAGLMNGIDKPLVPIYFTLKTAKIKVVINENSEFINGEIINETIITPSREEAEARTGSAEAFPLCDQLEFVAEIKQKHLDEAKELDKEIKYNCNYFNCYKAQLLDFYEKSKIEEIKILINYIENGSLIDDLINSGVVKYEDICADNSGKGKYLGYFVRFVIQRNGENINLDELQDIKTEWSKICSTSNVVDLCYDTGDINSVLQSYPKIQGNAKLVSANDKVNFVFRGRFETGDEAFLVSKENVLKVHKMLTYLIDTVGLKVDNQIIVTWAIDNDFQIEQPYGSSTDFWNQYLANDSKTDNQIILDAKDAIYIDYAKEIRKALLSYNAKFEKHNPRIAIMAIDSVTSGRTSVTFYQEFDCDKYYQKIADWHNSVKWEIEYTKKEKDDKGRDRTVYFENRKELTFIGAPSIDDIVLAVYGDKKTKNDNSYDKLKKNARERLIHCIFSGQPISKDLVFGAFNRAIHPLSLENKEAKVSAIHWYKWHKTLSVACALYKKYHFENKKEELEMELEETRSDRDYLFGRLLAIADKIERTAFFKQTQGKKDLERPTTAINLMSAFTNRPYQTWGVINKQLNPYFKQLNGAYFYQSIIDDVLSKFKSGDFEKNNALSPLYLLGYSAQRKVLNNKKIFKEEDSNE